MVGKKGAATLQEQKKERRLGRDLQLAAADDEEREAASAAAPWGMSRSLLAAGVLLPTLLAVGAALYQSGLYESVQGVNIAEVFREVEAKVTELGPWGYVLFAAIYILAEVHGCGVRGGGQNIWVGGLGYLHWHARTGIHPHVFSLLSF